MAERQSSTVLAAVTLLLALSTLTPLVQCQCRETDEVCEFWLQLEHRLTMMRGREAVYAQGGQLYMWDDVTASQPVNISEVITADGWENPRLVVAVNASIPGPPIEVWENQTVVVHVTNTMTSMAATIHWHGLHQTGSPWMDGVAFVTQCPIEPQQTFTYKFKASPRGTFWYHSHIGSQLSMGVVGAFIIRSKQDTPLPEHVLMLQEWNHDTDADLIMAQMVFGTFRNRQKVFSTKSIEGASFSMFEFHSGLINGRGRYYTNDNGARIPAPLTTFSVTPGQTYRFRMIGAGSLYPFRVSIDQHPLTVIATDGYEVSPITVDAIIINPGERYDFLVHATNTPGRYWVRAESLEIDVQFHIAEAILEYAGAPGAGGEATSSRQVCSSQARCKVLNCPFLFFPASYFSDCIHVADLRSRVKHEVPGEEPNEEVEDIFLNFAFPGDTETPGSVNGRAYKPREIAKSCEPDFCGEDKICWCPYSLSLEHNKVYQFILMNMGSGRGWAHPVHMHGHSYHVVKIGFPFYEPVTGQVGADSQDIDCGGQTTQYCNEPKWSNASWGGNSIPGLRLDLPPRKDTIMVPSGGYVVIRIKADNPGTWFMHCHIELHSADGMALVLNESFPNHPAPPAGFRTCGDFRFEKEEYGWPRSLTQSVNADVGTGDNNDGDDDDDISKRTFWITVGCLVLAILIEAVVIIVCCVRFHRHASKQAAITQPHYHNEGFNGK